MKKITLLLICSAFLYKGVSAQDDDQKELPVIGKKCPDFILREIINSNLKSAALQDFKGKGLILDFWSLGCASCIESFPVINDLQKTFKGRLEFMLVGQDFGEIRPFYKKIVARKKLELPSAIDRSLFTRFGIIGVPHEIWIDSSGIVRAVTYSEAVTKENIQAFLEGKKFDFLEKKANPEMIDVGKPMLLNGNGGADNSFLYRSIVAPFTTDVGFSTVVTDSSVKLTACTGFKNLYGAAYAKDGHYPYHDLFPYYRIIGEVSDTSKFTDSKKENMYCYEVNVPRSQSKNLRKFMQVDLDRFFGYSATIENRRIPVLRLTCMDSSKIKSTSNGDTLLYAVDGIKLTRQPAGRLAQVLETFLGEKIPVVDETGYSGNIDITFSANMTDIGEVKQQLKIFGLYLQEGEKEMPELIIRDRH